MNKGHVRVCSLSKLKEHTNSYDKKLFIVREPGKVDYERYGMVHVPELSPSPKLFSTYHTRWKNGHFIGAEKHIIENGKTKTWFDLYELQFIREMEHSEDMINSLIRIEELLNEGINILLVCFCPNLDNCHRKLIGERIKEKGYTVYLG